LGFEPHEAAVNAMLFSKNLGLHQQFIVGLTIGESGG
jgi:hypothetical protein